MAEQRTIAAGKHGGEPIPALTYSPVANGICLAVEASEAARP